MMARGPSERRSYPPDVQAAVLREVAVPGATVAEVARRHGIPHGTIRSWASLQNHGVGLLPPKPAASAWCLFSDWHLGALVEARHMSGRFAFDTDIARERVALLGREIRRSLIAQAGRFDVKRLYLLWAGDILDGHLAFRGQRYRLQLATTRQQRNFGVSLIVPFVQDLADAGVPEVVCVATEGNHGRSAHADEEEPDSNADSRLFDEVAAETASERVAWQVGAFGEQIQDPTTGKLVAVEHGQFIGGSKHGSLTPGTFQHVYQRCAEIGAMLDVFAFGHRHAPVYVHGRPEVFANGSLTGFNEFARDRGFRPCQPQQWTWGLTESGLAWSESIVLGGWAESVPDERTGSLKGKVCNS